MKMEILDQFKEKLEGAFGKFQETAASFRVSRPSPGLVSNILVECYGTEMPLQEIAAINIQLPNSLLIQAWDRANIQAIEKAILKSNLGVSPVVDGEIVRINLPPLTAERRNELVKALRKKAEETRIIFRTERDEARKKVTELFTEKQISEDDKFRAQEEIQKILDGFTARLQEFIMEREREIKDLA